MEAMISRGMIVLGVPDTREPGPADVRVVWEQINQILSSSKLLQIARTPHAALEERGSSHIFPNYLHTAV